jgi:hypothetical protein
MIARSALPQASSRYHGRGVVLPMSGGEAANRLGITLTSLYMLDDASGSIADEMGGTALAVTGAPTFRRVDAAGGIGVHYSAAPQIHSADVNALGVASGWYAAVFEDVSKAAVLTGIVGRANGAFTEVALLYLQSTGTTTAQLNDAGANPAVTVNGATANPKTTGGAWLAQLQVDRAAGVARTRFSSIGGGVVEQAQSSIAGYATFDGAGQVFGFGCLPALNYGAAVSWGAVATGVQCEGASFLANMARRMGVE